jgi:hypothetical protein
VLLLGITFMSLVSVKGSVSELLMASNAEGTVSTFQTGLAVIDFTIADPAHLPTSGPLGVPASVTLSTSGPFATTTGESISATAVRLRDCAPPPRSQAASSIVSFSAFSYEVTGEVDRNRSGQGQGAMSQGYILLGPKC